MKKLLIILSAFIPTLLMAHSFEVYSVNQQGTDKKLGIINVKKTPYGLVFTPKLQGLKQGLHGFHMHQNASCDAKTKNGKTVPALAAGGHYDPKKTGKHDTAWGNGHLGDLPPLYVNERGEAVQPVLAPRLSPSDLDGRALVIHAGGDNHSDHPKKLGGGGARMACGLVVSTQ